ncbi:hypothetical protein DK880_00204 [Candidatus Cardinium hertigii]|uniref:Uncharacterized protein n=1 Tax=Candidatus Cardinium hertigii TaxID=247481 RepID=A0A2Z3L7D3_9BACT|nr:hypothetical protein DK880_00204 [Candidatus Cardinium hertigii]
MGYPTFGLAPFLDLSVFHIVIPLLFSLAGERKRFVKL